MAGGTPLSLDASACHILLFSIMSVNGAPLSPITSGSPLSAVSGYFLSLLAGGGLLSAILGHFLSPVAGDIPLSIVSGCYLSLVAGGGPLSAILGRLLSFILSASSQSLFLTSTLSCTRCFSLPSLPLSHSSLFFLPKTLVRHPTLLTGKRLFNQAFITQKSITQ